MEAPEKIYLYPSDRAGEEYEDEWGTIPWGEGCVEYTRTDDFIDKAVRRLENYLDNGMWIANDVGYREKEAIIEDFRKYMEGE